MWQYYFEKNRQLWNDKVDVHLHSDFYRHTDFMAGRSSLTEIESGALGDVGGKSMLHLQCHFGQDSLSWARQGAVVTGVDFSEKAIETARQANAALGLGARFILADIYALPDRLEEQFDLVFTSYGTIVWLPDLDRWAAVIRQFLRPGGTFYMADFHPLLFMYDFDKRQLEYGYFTEKDPIAENMQGTYAEPKASIGGEEFSWNHSLSEIIMALLRQGLRLEVFREHDFSPYPCFPNMVEREPGRYVWGGFDVRFPHVYEISMKG